VFCIIRIILEKIKLEDKLNTNKYLNTKNKIIFDKYFFKYKILFSNFTYNYLTQRWAKNIKNCIMYSGIQFLISNRKLLFTVLYIPLIMWSILLILILINFYSLLILILIISILSSMPFAFNEK